jgi:serine/threonine-protein kinase
VPAASVAVLPLADVSSGRESDFFGDGMTEELIHALSRVPELRVAARTSVFALKGRAGDVRQIGRTLGVRSVLEGSVRRAGDRVRVNVRLVDASTGYERWAQSYDRRLSDVLAVQQEIAAAVAERLTDRLAPAGAGSAAATAAAATAGADTRSYQAFEHYLRGRHHLNQGGAAALARAADELGAAVAADPTYARAHAALADVYNRMAEERGARREQAALLAAPRCPRGAPSPSTRASPRRTSRSASCC